MNDEPVDPTCGEVGRTIRMTADFVAFDACRQTLLKNTG